MQKTQGGSSTKWYAFVTALLGWFAVITQFILLIENRITPLAETIIRFFSFFTILSNIIVAVTFSYIFLNGEGKWSRFFNKSTTLTAVTVYIIVVGAVYNIILRVIWHPEGLQKIVDELLHSVIPLLVTFFWILFVKKEELQWKDSFSWLLYPIVYTVFIAIRGAISDYYPYPFINVPAVGYPRALLNGLVLTVVFLCLSLFLIAVAKFISRKRITEG